RNLWGSPFHDPDGRGQGHSKVVMGGSWVPLAGQPPVAPRQENPDFEWPCGRGKTCPPRLCLREGEPLGDPRRTRTAQQVLRPPQDAPEGRPASVFLRPLVTGPTPSPCDRAALDESIALLY